jgi:hypothetical protein
MGRVSRSGNEHLKRAWTVGYFLLMYSTFKSKASSEITTFVHSRSERNLKSRVAPPKHIVVLCSSKLTCVVVQSSRSPRSKRLQNVQCPRLPHSSAKRGSASSTSRTPPLFSLVFTSDNVTGSMAGGNLKRPS